MKRVARLIQTFVPENYNLSLSLDRVGRAFHGVVTIKGLSADIAKDIRLHAKDLNIHSITFDGKAATFTQENDELVITHPDFVPAEHIVVVEFSGVITDGMYGLYPCYFEDGGVKKELLATQFESHFAREVFPCIDEPEAKATFDLTLTTELGVTVLSNTPIKQQRTENKLLVTSFETTPRMSTYLLAWVVGELHKKTASTKSGVEVNVWATVAQPARTLDFALGIATRTIDFLEDFFETPYPLAKSDNVALPDFSSGAMENWGLVTYREVALLVDPKTTSVANRQHVATTIAHELSHQWFGNLVTMKWWNDLWLNESFANFMEYFVIDELEPTWGMWLDYASLEVIMALRRDSISGVQSIRTDVTHPDEISSLFDPSIVYAKGGRLLQMLVQLIGQKAFQHGLKSYFKKYAYQNTEADDLWKCMSEASGQDIGSFMHAWINQSGFPVLHATQDGDQVHLSQEQFFIGPHEESDKLWPIPLSSTCSEMPAIFAEREVTLTRHHTTVLRFNTGGTAHFVTHYSPQLLQNVLNSLGNLSDIDRLQLLHEQTLLAQAGIIASAELIPLLNYYRGEKAEAVWSIMAITINELKRFVDTDEAAEKKLRSFVGELASDEYERLGWEKRSDESETDTKLRSLIISLMLYSERADVLAEAAKLYASTPFEKLDPELRVGIAAAAVRYASDQKIVDELLELSSSTSSSELEEDIAAAVTSTKDPATIDRIIGLYKDTSLIRPQDLPRWYVWLFRNRYGRTKVWQWTRDNWKWLEKQYKGDHIYESIPRYIASSLITSQQLAEYKEFFEPLKVEPALKRNIDIGITELTGRVELLERDGPDVREALLNL